MLVPEGAHAGQRPMTLNRVFTLIGSAPQARLYLPSKTVSRCHAVVVNTPRGLFIRDLASRTGTIINGRPVREHDLRQGDVVQAGTYTFRFADASGGVGRAEIPGGGPPPAALEIDGLDEPVELETRVLLIGRRDTCDVSLTENSASSAHALILEANGRHVLRDLNSRTGTLVNGTAVHEHYLAPGDRIRIGDTSMRYVTRRRAGESAPRQSAAPPETMPPTEHDDVIEIAPEPIATRQTPQTAPAEPSPAPVAVGPEPLIEAESVAESFELGEREPPRAESDPEPAIEPEIEPVTEPVATHPQDWADGTAITPEPEAVGPEPAETFDLLAPAIPEPEEVQNPAPPAALPGGSFADATAPPRAERVDDAEPTLEDIVDALRRNLARDEPSESGAPQATEEELLGLSPRDEKAAGKIVTDPASATHYPSSADTLPRAAAPPPPPPARAPAAAPSAVPATPPPVSAPRPPDRKVAQPPRREPASARPSASKAPPPVAPRKPAAAAPASSLPLPAPPPGITRPVEGPRRTAAGHEQNKASPSKKAARTPKPRPVRPRDPLSLGSDPVDLDLLDEGKQSDNGNHRG
jgi:pSer/pThr/pTyr-binding forkhead associated (FHA) protein